MNIDMHAYGTVLCCAVHPSSGPNLFGRLRFDFFRTHNLFVLQLSFLFSLISVNIYCGGNTYIKQQTVDGTRYRQPQSDLSELFNSLVLRLDLCRADDAVALSTDGTIRLHTLSLTECYARNY